MPLDIIIGAQWGDEGKGRMVDMLSSNANIVARYSGGDNAGHTVTVGEDVFKLHLIPSGIIHPHTIGVLGNGMVINPETLLAEIAQLKEAGIEITPKRMLISPAAHLITPAHRALDAAQESARGKEQIGTTLRGIGPAYVDKAARRGLRAEDILDEEAFADKVEKHIESANQHLTKLYGAEALDPKKVAADYCEFARQLKPFVTDTIHNVSDALKAGKLVLAEGAQGALLDLDHGTYPYVTSSNPTAPSALVGLGLGIKYINDVIGVTKVFQTRVGDGAMPTEIEGDDALRLRGTGENPWDEYGTTTGRARRVGWLDMVLLRYTAQLNGMTKLALTKLDILSGFETLKICTAYQEGEKTHTDLPSSPSKLEQYEAIYEEMPGWQEDVSTMRNWEELPEAAKAYIIKIEEISEVKVGWVSVGPERDQLIMRP